jgi:hypothetical protein
MGEGPEQGRYKKLDRKTDQMPSSRRDFELIKKHGDIVAISVSDGLRPMN